MKKERLNILLVEDDPDDARLLIEIIGTGYKVETANQLKSVAGYLSNRRYDLIFLDLNLPDSTGLETVVSVLKLAPEIPIIVLTGLEDDTLAYDALQKGAQDFLIKGESSESQLHRSIRYAIERNRLMVSLKQVCDEREELEKALATQKKLMSGWQSGCVTATLAGIGPLRDREPEAFTRFMIQYGELLDYYLERLIYRKTLSKKRIEQLASRIGLLNGGPRDVIDLHLKVIEDKLKEALPQKARIYTVDGRLLALELMGFLVDFYRMGALG